MQNEAGQKSHAYTLCCLAGVVCTDRVGDIQGRKARVIGLGWQVRKSVRAVLLVTSHAEAEAAFLSPGGGDA